MTWKFAAGYGMPVEVWTMGAISYLLLAGKADDSPSVPPLNSLFIGYAPFDRNTREREIEAIIAGATASSLVCPYRAKHGVTITRRGYWNTGAMFLMPRANSFTAVPCSTPGSPQRCHTTSRGTDGRWTCRYTSKSVRRKKNKYISRFFFSDFENGIHLSLIVIVREAVFSLMVMKRMSMLAVHLPPELEKFNEHLFEYKVGIEKEVLQRADVIHHHNAEQDPAPAGLNYHLDHHPLHESPEVEGEDLTDRLAAGSHINTLLCVSILVVTGNVADNQCSGDFLVPCV
ncbi:hypothetical protein EDD15DRAFT_796670 [Pisolithus albus]|nr:hypothetical protein EDD15DRAFT_796670 [Pisolithus albus]